MPSQILITLLALVPIINSYVFSYYLYYAGRFKEFTTTIVNIPYYMICSLIFYYIITFIYPPDKMQLLYIYIAIASASILYTVLSLQYPKLSDTINEYIPVVPKK
jgi:hypothetical protein